MSFAEKLIFKNVRHIRNKMADIFKNQFFSKTHLLIIDFKNEKLKLLGFCIISVVFAKVIVIAVCIFANILEIFIESVHYNLVQKVKIAYWFSLHPAYL